MKYEDIKIRTSILFQNFRRSKSNAGETVFEELMAKHLYSLKTCILRFRNFSEIQTGNKQNKKVGHNGEAVKLQKECLKSYKKTKIAHL